MNVLCEVMPSLRPLEHSPDNVQFAIDCRVGLSRCIALANVRANLRSHHPANHNIAEALVDRFYALVFSLYAARRKARFTIRKEALSRGREGKSREVVVSRSELARLGIPNKIPLLALCLSPVTCVQRLPEPLTVDEEMGVPSVTAFFECH
jgi:hypothetical protein